VGVDTDLLFPVEEQRFLHEQVPGSAFALLRSNYGHDGFLVETDQLTKAIRKFYQSETINELYYEQQTV
jgi:homoserine O-acetyltransferase/O-succinyltransferase